MKVGPNALNSVKSVVNESCLVEISFLKERRKVYEVFGAKALRKP